MKTHSKTRVVGYVGLVESSCTPSGVFICRVSVAATERWLPKDQRDIPREKQEWKEKTTWHPFRFVGEYWEKKLEALRVGDPVEITGIYQNDEYEDKDGNKKFSSYFKGDFVNILKRSTSKRDEGLEQFDDAIGEDIPF